MMVLLSGRNICCVWQQEEFRLNLANLAAMFKLESEARRGSEVLELRQTLARLSSWAYTCARLTFDSEHIMQIQK